jgi:hypothetical protein
VNVKRIKEGVYEVVVPGGCMTPDEHLALYQRATEALRQEMYEPTEQELTSEALLWDWIDRGID